MLSSQPTNVQSIMVADDQPVQQQELLDKKRWDRPRQLPQKLNWLLPMGPETEISPAVCSSTDNAPTGNAVRQKVDGQFCLLGLDRGAFTVQIHKFASNQMNVPQKNSRRNGARGGPNSSVIREVCLAVKAVDDQRLARWLEELRRRIDTNTFESSVAGDNGAWDMLRETDAGIETLNTGTFNLSYSMVAAQTASATFDNTFHDSGMTMERLMRLLDEGVHSIDRDRDHDHDVAPDVVPEAPSEVLHQSTLPSVAETAEMPSSAHLCTPSDLLTAVAAVTIQSAHDQRPSSDASNPSEVMKEPALLVVPTAVSAYAKGEIYRSVTATGTPVKAAVG